MPTLNQGWQRTRQVNRGFLGEFFRRYQKSVEDQIIDFPWTQNSRLS